MIRLLLAASLAAAMGQHAAAAAEIALPAGTALTAEIVAGLVREELAGRGLVGELAVEVRQPAAAVANEAGTAMRVALVELRHDRRTGRYQGRIEAALPTGETTAIATAGRVDELVEVTVPARPIARGEMIAAVDLAAAKLPLASLPDDGLRRLEDLVGRQAVRALAAGRPARAGEVAAPWQVRRGEMASMAFSRGGLQIVTAGEVLENGRQGQTVRVRNAASGELREALVVGQRRVEVLGGPP